MPVQKDRKCKCGCGTALPAHAGRGRPREYATPDCRAVHNARSTVAPARMECAGCGKSFEYVRTAGRPPKYCRACRPKKDEAYDSNGKRVVGWAVRYALEMGELPHGATSADAIRGVGLDPAATSRELWSSLLSDLWDAYETANRDKRAAAWNSLRQRIVERIGWDQFIKNIGIPLAAK